jgi:hypothetical protein
VREISAPTSRAARRSSSRLPDHWPRDERKPIRPKKILPILGNSAYDFLMAAATPVAGRNGRDASRLIELEDPSISQAPHNGRLV